MPYVAEEYTYKKTPRTVAPERIKYMILMQDMSYYKSTCLEVIDIFFFFLIISLLYK